MAIQELGVWIYKGSKGDGKSFQPRLFKLLILNLRIQEFCLFKHKSFIKTHLTTKSCKDL
jgi:hypothetical protein